MNILLDYDNETDNKYRWKTDVDGVRFSMYIPKWRVPKPIPRSININIYSEEEIEYHRNTYSKEDYENDEGLKLQKIIAKVERKSDHIERVRFDPVGVPKTWEIGSPYIPIELLPFREINSLIITVEWMYKDV